MKSVEPDNRSPERRRKDEELSAQPQLPPLDLPAGAIGSPMEMHLKKRQRRPLALSGIVENGLVRLVDSDVKLPEHSRVIVVAESI